ncbi:hypothetical protein BV20DRAFT_551981 [Pilatotrama ljubarskyi]|nr:hypothetical protein BV20DRAFT_551981 [Pilatotrama ljubarskyi]
MYTVKGLLDRQPVVFVAGERRVALRVSRGARHRRVWSYLVLAAPALLPPTAVLLEAGNAAFASPSTVCTIPALRGFQSDSDDIGYI